jgi:hypothetical protein
MIDLAAKLLSEVAYKLIEIGVDRVFTPQTPPPPATDPISEAEGAVSGFLTALAERDSDTLWSWCEPTLAQDPNTMALLEASWDAAAPVSWSFRERYVPSDWTPHAVLPWVVFDLVVTFDTGEGRYETIPAVLRSDRFGDGWLISYLEWESAPEEPIEVLESDEVVDLSDIFSDIFSSQVFPVVIDCARCGQQLSVPVDKGRLRVTCPTCKNVEWFDP